MKKSIIQDKYREKINKALLEETNDGDWTEMSRLLESIFCAFLDT